MKLKLIALALGVAALSSSLHAKDAKVLSPKKTKKALIKKEKSESSHLTFFGASDVSPITLTGGGPFTPLTFTQFQFSHGKGIIPDSTGSVFTLTPGIYSVTFSGTFQVTQPTVSDVGVNYDIALQLGANPPIFVNTDSGRNQSSGFNAFDLSVISKVIQVTSPTTLSIVASDTSAASTAVTVTTRSIIIEKFE